MGMKTLRNNSGGLGYTQSLINLHTPPSPTLERWVWPWYLPSWGSITSAVPALDQQRDWLNIVLHHQTVAVSRYLMATWKLHL